MRNESGAGSVSLRAARYALCHGKFASAIIAWSSAFCSKTLRLAYAVALMRSTICSRPTRANRLSNDTRMFFPVDAVNITTISAATACPDGKVTRTREPTPGRVPSRSATDPSFPFAVTVFSTRRRGATNGSRSISARLRCADSIDIRSIVPICSADFSRSSIALKASAIRDLNRV